MNKEENKQEVITTNKEIKKILEREDKEREALTDEVKQEAIDRAEALTEESPELKLTKDETIAFNKLMNNYDAYTVDKTLVECFEGIFRNTKYYVEAAENYSAQTQALVKDAGVYNAEYLGRKQEDLNKAFDSTVNTYGELVQRRLSDIKVNLLAKAQQLPLGSTEFNTAFNLINVAGKNINDNTLKQIAEQFRGDIASLRALKSTAEAFGAAGASYFAELIIDPVQAVGKLQQQAISLFGNAPSMPGMTSMAMTDAMTKDTGNMKYKAVLFGKELEKLTELANIKIMPWYTEIVATDEASDIAFLAGFNSNADGGYNNVIAEASEASATE